MRREIRDFVGRAIESGCSRDTIAKALADAGWPRAEIDRSLASFADIAFPIAVPRPVSRLTARETFLYLVFFTSLYFVVWHLVATLFHVVNAYIPDPARQEYRHWYEYDARWNLSMLAVCMPVFVIAFLYAARQVERDSSARDSGPRRWLGYLTMFLGTCAIMISVANLVYYTLLGEATLRFVLKCIIVMGVGGSTIGWFAGRHWRGEEK